MQKSFKYNDGGRSENYKGTARDCVVRAIAIATEKPYQEVYDAINIMGKSEKLTKRYKQKSSSRSGVYRKTYQKYLESIGWEWVPTMKIGSGCKVHLVAHELPHGRIICRLSRHVCAVVDGVINDIYDPSRGGTRCVYGYFIKTA